MPAPAEAAQARGAISRTGKDEQDRSFQILLTWVLAGKYYQTRFPSPPAERPTTAAAASRKSAPQNHCSKGPRPCGLA